MFTPLPFGIPFPFSLNLLYFLPHPPVAVPLANDIPSQATINDAITTGRDGTLQIPLCMMGSVQMSLAAAVHGYSSSDSRYS